MKKKNAIKTINALQKAAKDVASLNPTTLLVITPHGPFFKDHIYVSNQSNLYGNFAKFGAEKVELNFKNNLPLMQRILQKAKEKEISSGPVEPMVLKRFGISEGLDHGTLVPLYFITKWMTDFKLIHISVADFEFDMLKSFGKCIYEAISETDETVVIVASGDLSHCLSTLSPYGMKEEGIRFDAMFNQCIDNNDFDPLLSLDTGFYEKAGECGLRSFIMMFGAIEPLDFKPERYSYEGPFGIGYSVTAFLSR